MNQKTLAFLAVPILAVAGVLSPASAAGHEDAVEETEALVASLVQETGSSVEWVVQIPIPFLGTPLDDTPPPSGPNAMHCSGTVVLDTDSCWDTVVLDGSVLEFSIRYTPTYWGAFNFFIDSPTHWVHVECDVYLVFTASKMDCWATQPANQWFQQQENLFVFVDVLAAPTVSEWAFDLQTLHP